ncbi:MAG: hypothetical protein BKP49_09365 [Treponema sp. CETP13]|nr:MAG: hypothetical protein BKP49_09365 [Treponema sp. CETP13]
MNLHKKYFIFYITCIYLLCTIPPLFARNAVYNGEKYTLDLLYTDVAYPGDAIYMELNYTPHFSLFSSYTYSIEATAKLMIAGNRETLRKTNLFLVNSEKQKLVGYIPLSSWYTESNFNLKITYQIFRTKKHITTAYTDKMEFDVPVNLIAKKFHSEKIDLDDVNSSIKTDSSKERAIQINTLNKVIRKVSSNDIYQTKKFSSPVESTRRTAFFGDRRTYVYSNGTSSSNLHYGIDFGVPTGTAVYACGNGKVVLAENRITTGWTVVIEHLPGIYSLYYHLDSYSVKVGQMVKQGEQIALSGSTGLATGPHLHWEMRMYGEAVSPDWFMTEFSGWEKTK